MKHLLLLATTAALAGCATSPAIEPRSATSVPPPVSSLPDAPDIRLAALFERYDEAQLALSPIGKAYRGIVDQDYGRWDDLTDAAAEREQALDRATLAKMQAEIARSALSPEHQLSYDLFESVAQRSRAAYAFRENEYLFDQMNGLQSFVPAFLINIHRVTDLPTAEAYVSRLQTADVLIDQALAEASERQRPA